MSELYGTEPTYYLEFEVAPGEWRRGSAVERKYGFGYVDAFTDAFALGPPGLGVRLVRVAYPGDSGTVIATSMVQS